MRYVYTLIDPRDNVVRYVGQTNKLKKRFSSHLRDKDNTRKTSWIKSLVTKDLLPIMKVIIICEDSFSDQYEISCMNIYNETIYNTVAGGTGGNKRVWDDAEKKRHSLLMSHDKAPMFGKFSEDHVASKKVAQYDNNMNLIHIHGSISQAGRDLSIDSSCITKCCKYKRRSAGGYVWRYI